MNKNNKQQETTYLYWSNGILLGIISSLTAGFFVTTFFRIYEKFDCSLNFFYTLDFIIFIISLITLLALYFKFKLGIRKITQEHFKEFNQDKLDKELDKNRLKSALKVFKNNPDLYFNYTKGLKIVLDKKENPLDFLKTCKQINEIDTSQEYTQEEYFDFFIHQEPFGEMVIIERFFNNDYSKPFDDKFWKELSSRLISIGDFFGSAAGYETICLLLYCLICNITKQPILDFAMGSDYDIQRKELNNLIQLLNSNSNVTSDIKNQLNKINKSTIS